MPKTKGKKAASGRDSKYIAEVDFSDTESRGGKKRQGGRKHYPEGDYGAKVKSAELIISSEKKTPGIGLAMELTTSKHKGKPITDRLWLSEGAMWKVRGALEAMGVKVPSKATKIDVRKLVGKTCAITLEDDEYDDKIYSSVSDYFLLSELDDDADEDEDEDDDEDDEDDDDEDEDDDDEDDDDDDLEEVDLDL